MNDEISQRIIKSAQHIEYAILKKYMDNRQSIYAKEYEKVPMKSMKSMVFDSFQHGCIKSESGTEFNMDDGNNEGNYKSSGMSTQGSSSSTSPHPSYHLNKQRLMSHTFESNNKDVTCIEHTTKDMESIKHTEEECDTTASFTSWHVILKASGIWETMTEFGLTYKFIITPKYNEV